MMRHFMNIVESPRLATPLNESFDYASATPEELRQDAEGHETDFDHGKAEDFDWRFDAAYPLSKLVSQMPGGVEGWHEWWRDEVGMDADEELGREWSALAEEDIRDPIIISEDGKLEIWDGWHRTAACIVSGRTTIPAIVGTTRA